MPQYIEFQGETIEFPDGMDDGAIAKALGGGREPEKSYGERVLTESLPAVANMGGDILRSIPAGIRGAGEAIATGSMQRGFEGFESSMDTLRKHTPTFGGERVQAAEQALGEGIEHVVTGVGNVAEDAALKWAQAGHERKLPIGTASPGVRTGAEVALNFLPIPGASLVSRIPKIGSKARASSAAAKHEALIAEAERVQTELQSAKQQTFTDNAVQSEFPGFSELTKEAQPRTPYNLPDSLRQQLEAELNPPVEQRLLGQGELFGEKPVGVIEPGRQREAQTLEYTTEGSKKPTFEGQQALAQGPDALRSGAQEQLTMDGLEYPTQKPRFTGPKATERQHEGVYKDQSFERQMNIDESEFKAKVDAMNKRQQFKEEFFERQRRETAEDAAKSPIPFGGVGKRGFRQGGAVKLPGGMWHPQAVERLARPLVDSLAPPTRGEGVTPIVASGAEAEGAWAVKAIRNYLNRYAGTERDPLKDVEIPFGEGTKRWEELWDKTVVGAQARAMQGRAAATADIWSGFPEVEKARPEEPIFNFGDFTGGRGSAGSGPAITSYLSHVGDYLRQNVDPAKLQQYDLVRAVKETAENDKRLAKEMEKAQAASTKDLPVHKEYPDGYRWVELKLPEKLTEEQKKTVKPMTRKEMREDLDMGEELTPHDQGFMAIGADGKPITNAYTGGRASAGTPEAAWLAGRLAEEGNIMGHCVGGYCEGVASGESRIFSLRDPKGGSHVTVEVEPFDPRRVGKEPHDFYHRHATEEFRDRLPVPTNDLNNAGIKWTRAITQSPEYQAWAKTQPENIQQIKGKQNRAPEAKYRPYVQDFVQSGNWRQVGDLHNTGLLNKADVMRLANQQGNTDILQILDTEYKDQVYVPQELRDAVFSSSETRLLMGGVGRRGFGQGGAITPFADFKKDLKARKINIPDEAAKAIWEKQKPKEKATTSGLPTDNAIALASNISGLEKIQRQYADRRTLDEIKPEIAAMSRDTVADMANLNTVGKIINGRFISKDNPLLSWVSSQIHWTKQGSIAKANERLHGASRKAPDPGTYNYVWQQLDRQSRIAVNEVGQALNNAPERVDVQSKARELLKRELTPKELQAYEDRVRINKQVLTDINAILKAEGKEPIHELPHYWSPAIFTGPFKVRFLNDKGETVKVQGFYTKPDQAKLEKAAPGYKVEVMSDTGLKGDIDWDQFEWILRQLSKETRDPAAKAISEGIRKQGFGKHGLKRKGVAGASGTEGGVQGLRAYEETSERYIRQAYDYLANRQLDKLYKQVNELEEANHLPFTKAYATDAIDVARGGSNKWFEEGSKVLSALMSGTIELSTGGKLVLPQRFTRDLIRYGNKVKTTLLLGFFHPIHIGAQILQSPTFMPPKLMAMAAESGMNPITTVMSAMGKGLAEYMKWNDSADAKKLQQMGAFDATFKYDWSTYAGDSNPRFKQSVADHLTGISLLSGLEAHAVRRPAAHMFLAMLRELGYDKIAKSKDEIYQVAREMTDHYMVSNRHYEKSHMFSRTGLAGMATSPLQSFSTTWLGMLREYAKLSTQGILEAPKKPGQAISKQFPLAAFMAANVLTAGILGVVGIKEWDAIAAILNKYFGYNVPSGTEWVLSKFKSQKLRFGVLSDALGVHVGATFNSPTLTGSFAPGVTALGEAANFGWQKMKETGILGESNKPTNVEMRDAKKGVFPRFSVVPGLNWGDVEEKATPPGAPYQESSGAAGPYTRDKQDTMARRFGTYTNKEVTEKTEFYTAKKQLAGRQTKFNHTMNRAVDIILTDPSASEKLSPMWNELGERGFSSKDIVEGLKREIKSQLVEGDIRAKGKGQSTKQQQLILLLQKLEGQR